MHHPSPAYRTPDWVRMADRLTANAPCPQPTAGCMDAVYGAGAQHRTGVDERLCKAKSGAGWCVDRCGMDPTTACHSGSAVMRLDERHSKAKLSTGEGDRLYSDGHGHRAGVVKQHAPCDGCGVVLEPVVLSDRRQVGFDYLWRLDECTVSAMHRCWSELV
jgi:hypothetical protein